MSEQEYVLHADEPLYKRVPPWAWIAGAVALLLLVFAGRRGRRSTSGYEDYLK